MQWIVCHELELYLVVFYIGYQSAIYYMQQDVESTSELDSKEVNTPIGPNGPCSELKHLIGTIFGGWIGYQITLVHKGVFLITQGYIEYSE